MIGSASDIFRKAMRASSPVASGRLRSSGAEVAAAALACGQAALGLRRRSVDSYVG